MNEPIFFDPIFQERIWGGENLKKFGYQIPSNSIGECWAFSAHQNGQSIAKNGPYKGKTLGQLWENHRELFGNISGDRFPLLTKILDANDDLSVQVHPNDNYARVHENGELGKTECWYIIDCDTNAEIIYGHHANTKEEFIEMINEGQWNNLLRRVPVERGDFFFVPSGTIHAIGKGIMILETQQNSDTTYRVYDYDRKDSNGNTRELHIDKSIDVTAIPAIIANARPEKQFLEGLEITTFIRDKYFTVHKWDINGKASIDQIDSFQLVSVISGEGTIRTDDTKETPFKKGDHFMLPNGIRTISLMGTTELIVSHI